MSDLIGIIYIYKSSKLEIRRGFVRCQINNDFYIFIKSQNYGLYIYKQFVNLKTNKFLIWYIYQNFFEIW